MKRTVTGLLAFALALTMNAQPVAAQLGKGIYNGKIGLQHAKHINDDQLREMGRRNSATAVPTKAQAARLVGKALATNPAKRALKAPTAVERTVGANYSASDTLLWESWESWDGKTFAWVPSSWKRFTNFDESKYINESTGSCPTWLALETDGYYVPYATDGFYTIACLYGEDILAADNETVLATAPQQDEWLVSPTVSNVQSSNYLSFDLAFTPIFTYLTGTAEEPEFDFNNVIYDLEVLVTTETRSASNDEKKYTRLFRLSDIVSEMFASTELTDEAALTQLLSMRWQHFRLPLTDFAGKSIRVALRYTGMKGGAVMIDALRISDLLPVAMYDRPEGSFYLGFSDDARLNYQKIALMPAYVDNVWTNYSNHDADSFVWRYNVDGQSATSTDRDLVMPGMAPTSMQWPTLQANAELRADEYKGATRVVIGETVSTSTGGTVKVGGDATMAYDNGTQISFGLGNFDPTKLYWLGEISNSGGAYAFGTGSDAFWSGITNTKYNKVSGIANVFDKPASPYVFSQVKLPLGNYFNVGANIYCTVYEARELDNGGLEITDNVLGQATAGEATSASGGYILPFTFPNLMIVSTPIAISITGLDNSNVIDFAPLSQAKNHDSDKGYAFVLLKNQSSGDVWWCEIASALSSVDGTGNMEISHCFGLNAVFPYLHSNDGNVFHAAAQGETKSFDISSYWHPAKQSDTDMLNGWTVTSSDTWVTASSSIDETAQKASVVVKAAAMPAGVTGRKATVTITATGCQETILVVQGDADAIDTPVMEQSRAEGTFTLSGMRVQGNGARKGIYLEKRNGRYVKVLK